MAKEKTAPPTPSFTLVESTHQFVFKNKCPYCNGDMIYQGSNFSKEDDGTWIVDEINGSCSNEPNSNSPDWTEFISTHSDMPYVYQLPVDIECLQIIQQKYRVNITT